MTIRKCIYCNAPGESLMEELIDSPARDVPRGFVCRKCLTDMLYGDNPDWEEENE